MPFLEKCYKDDPGFKFLRVLNHLFHHGAARLSCKKRLKVLGIKLSKTFFRPQIIFLKRIGVELPQLLWFSKKSQFVGIA